MKRVVLILVPVLLVTAASGAVAERLDFSRDIQPILADRCYHCHGPDEKTRKAKFRLDTRDGAFRVKAGQAVIVPGDAAASELIHRITSNDPEFVMPPPDAPRPLQPAEIERLRTWVAQGAKWAEHWAFVPPRRPVVPTVSNLQARVVNPIDSFIFARLAAEGLTPSAKALRTTLIRRVTLDLTGLPPTPDEVAAFLTDRSANAYERVVDRLLASPRYGERMVWDWLDAARYADSNGFQGDPNRTMWHWRDWAIGAFNENLPYDQFTVQQLAGDLLPGATVSQKVASGFHRNHMINAEGGRIEEESRVDYVQDRTETTATVWLGLTMNCCRCHDHKYDPLTQREYYQLSAYFNNVPETGGADAWPNAKPILPLPSREQAAQREALERRQKEFQRQRDELEKDLRAQQTAWEQTLLTNSTKLPTNLLAVLRRTDAERTKEQAKALADYHLTNAPARVPLQKQLDETAKSLKELIAAIPVTMIMGERDQPRETFILLRGAYDKYGDKVSAGVPAVLPPLPTNASASRLALARWLVSPDHPLTARVAVNRAWQLFFGVGLVKTAEDFGVQGEKPSHPELLDWLATEFIHTAWDVKALHRLILTSATYRQASGVTPALAERDPENRLLARGPRYRLPSWMLRDQALAISGLLVEKIGGRPVKPYQPAGVWEDATFGQIRYEPDRGEKLYRRSLYTFWRRIVGPTMFFDTAARQTCAVRQPRTNTPLHALVTLNDITFVEAARQLAGRVLRHRRDDEERLAYAFQLCAARSPSIAEQAVLRDALKRLRQHYTTDPEAARKLISVGDSLPATGLEVIELAAWTGLGSLLLNLDEVITKE